MTELFCMGGAVTDIVDRNQTLARIVEAAEGPYRRTLGVASVNLEHLFHLRLGTLMPAPSLGVEWLSLVDGTPIAWRARLAASWQVPKLSGADLILPILDAAEQEGLSFGVLGGRPDASAAAAEQIARRWPRLRIAGMWTPERAELDDPDTAAAIAEDIAQADVDILMVCLGKPRQEQWIARWGPASRVKVALAFGGTVDFLAGRIRRAPGLVSELGLEWLWRLAREPRRLAKRYLVQCPPGGYRLLLHSHELPALRPAAHVRGQAGGVRFVTDPDAAVDISVVTVTYRNGAAVHDMIDSVRAASRGLRVRFVVVDNDSGDDTMAELASYDDLVVVDSGANLGYAGGINVGRAHVGVARAVLVLNPDIVLERSALQRMLAALDTPGVVSVVPHFLRPCGAPEHSLRREPSLARTLGDAVLGSLFPRRPGWSSETVMSARQYKRSHPIVWAVGAAVMVDGRVSAEVGDWDERFFLYSEEVEYFRRLREHGTILYEAEALMWHTGGQSGTSDELFALMLVNKRRYYELNHGPVASWFFGLFIMIDSLLRIPDTRHRAALPYLRKRSRWSELPRAGRPRLGHGGPAGQGSVATADAA